MKGMSELVKFRYQKLSLLPANEFNKVNSADDADDVPKRAFVCRLTTQLTDCNCLHFILNCSLHKNHECI